MSTYFLSLVRARSRPQTPEGRQTQFAAIWPEAGAVTVNGRPCPVGRGAFVEGNYLLAGPDSQWLRFELTLHAPTTDKGDETVLLSETVSLEGETLLLRLDEVSFPPNTCAYRHTHPGPGIRHLTLGGLHLEADDDDHHAKPGDSWFEAANSPVKATSSPDSPKTRFVRFMALPPEFLGKPTINILDPSDAERPRIQRTQRHFDQIVHLSPGA